MTQAVEFPFTAGDAFRRARIDADLTAKDLAAGLHVDYQTVLRWEKGAKIPRGENLAKIVELTGATWLPDALNRLRTRSRCSGVLADDTLSVLAA